MLAMGVLTWMFPTPTRASVPTPTSRRTTPLLSSWMSGVSPLSPACNPFLQQDFLNAASCPVMAMCSVVGVLQLLTSVCNVLLKPQGAKHSTRGSDADDLRLPETVKHFSRTAVQVTMASALRTWLC